ncbi:MAG TPA: glycosyltransferase family 2 protein [Candidatus Binatia bacterium]|nr:glycosyltransferase family 2 protein [Candidatus Binatia bacterium]
MSAPSVSVVICTRNRPGDLAECLASLARQTCPADEVIVVDASDGAASRAVVEGFAGRLPGLCHVRATPGLTRQRNIGIARSAGDVVTFLDDDVVLARDYLDHIGELFALDPTLAGVEGTVAIPAPLGRRRLANAFRRFFLMNSLGRPRGVKRSGFVAYDPAPQTVQPVTSLVGCNMSYRRDVFARFRFDEWFAGYGLGEDQDFSYRVGRWMKLAQTPYARLEHRVSPVARASLPALHEMTVVNHFYFVAKNLRPTLLTWLAFAWSELGELVSVLKTADRASIAGKLRGWRRVAGMIARPRLRVREMNV